jgi:hypothetical protein
LKRLNYIDVNDLLFARILDFVRLGLGSIQSGDEGRSLSGPARVSVCKVADFGAQPFEKFGCVTDSK